MMTDLLIVTLVDKFLLALLLLGVAAYLARALERFKSSLSWGAELLKARLEASKNIMLALSDLQSAHDLIINNIAIGNTPNEESCGSLLNDPVLELDARIRDASLLFKPQTIKKCGTARQSFFLFLEHYEKSDFDAIQHLSEVNSELKKAISAMREELVTE